MNSPRIAGLDVGFSSRKPTAGIGLWVDSRLELTNCHGVEACARITAAGNYDIVATQLADPLPDSVDKLAGLHLPGLCKNVHG
jgi:hypothetical protein